MNPARPRKSWRWSIWLKLLAAGWRPGRDVWAKLDLSALPPIFPEARRILSEFGGLRFGHPSGTVVDLDPSAGAELGDCPQRFERLVQSRLLCIGYYEHQDRVYLIVGENGTIYTLIEEYQETLPPADHHTVSYELEPLASSFERAVDLILRSDARKSETSEDLRANGLLGRIWTLESD